MFVVGFKTGILKVVAVSVVEEKQANLTEIQVCYSMWVIIFQNTYCIIKKKKKTAGPAVYDVNI